jgi:hypothetical protein
MSAKSAHTSSGNQPGAYDSWVLESNEYSPDKFYTKSTDGRGNSELIQVKVSPFVYGLLAEIIESPDFPDYRTKADLIRDALVHRLHHLREMAKDTTRMDSLKRKTGMLMQEAQAERLKAEMEQEARFVDALIDIMAAGAMSGNVTALGEAIDQAERALDGLPFHLADRLRREISMKISELSVLRARAAIEVGEMERHG